MTLAFSRQSRRLLDPMMGFGELVLGFAQAALQSLRNVIGKAAVAGWRSCLFPIHPPGSLVPRAAPGIGIPQRHRPPTRSRTPPPDGKPCPAGWIGGARAARAAGMERTSPAALTIDPREAAHFGALAADWWNPKGSSAMLHRLNPVRLRFIREAIDRHFGTDDHALRPLAGKRALDAGCGAGLLCEPLARLGAEVTGVDAAPENIAAARVHAEGSGLAIDYRAGEIGALKLGSFELVCALEVIEHVTDKAAFLRALADTLAPDGLMVLSCPNRTPASRVLLVEAAERLGQVPRGTHDWSQFATPEELAGLAADAGLQLDKPAGIAWSPLKGLHLSADLSLNFIVTARRASSTRT